EALLDMEAARTDFYTWFDDDSPKISRGVASERDMDLASTSGWFREMVVERIGDAVSELGIDLQDVRVAARVWADMPGYGVSEGVPKSMLPRGAQVLLEGSDNTEVSVSLYGAASDVLLRLVEAGLIDDVDQEEAYVSVSVQYTVYYIQGTKRRKGRKNPRTFRRKLGAHRNALRRR
ncbi:MAG: hypothetical protein ABIO70_15910, partial [Pseudomonadota bacterium]